MEERFVSDKEVSKMMGIGRQTLANWRGQQRGPRYVKAGRSVRYCYHHLTTDPPPTGMRTH
jgi:predicted DNA-binding transcriptional regulator AlpA